MRRLAILLLFVSAAASVRAADAVVPDRVTKLFNGKDLTGWTADVADFWCIQENIEVPDMETRRPRKDGEKWGGAEGDARRILNLTDGSEKPLGEWNTMVIEARGRGIKVWVNDDLVNEGSNATADRGRIALQAEGTEVEFRRIDIGPLPPSGR
jgi:hypothetical protein